MLPLDFQQFIFFVLHFWSYTTYDGDVLCRSDISRILHRLQLSKLVAAVIEISWFFKSKKCKCIAVSVHGVICILASFYVCDELRACRLVPLPAPTPGDATSCSSVVLVCSFCAQMKSSSSGKLCSHGYSFNAFRLHCTVAVSSCFPTWLTIGDTQWHN